MLAGLREHASGIHGDRAAGHVYGADPVHARERDHDLRPARIRDRAAAESRIAAAGHHRRVRGGASRDHFSDFPCRRRAHHAVRSAVVHVEQIAAVRRDILRRRQDIPLAGRGGEALVKCGAYING